MAQITENPARVGARNRAGNNLNGCPSYHRFSLDQPGSGSGIGLGKDQGAFAFGLAPGASSRAFWPPLASL